MNRSQSTNKLENRLLEMFDALWDDFVDPREPYADVDGQWWPAMGALHGSTSGPACSTMNEQQLRELRDECRRLAVTNEFAINGHENRINYTVGPGHSYLVTIAKGSSA